jgi:diguanylate cyclase (GGDEF)-like protein
MYRQATPREVLAATTAQTGKHLGVTRCLVAVGSSAEAAPLVAEYFAPGVSAAGAPWITAIARVVSSAQADALSGIALDAVSVPSLRELGLESVLAVALTDKETQAPAGALLVCDATPRKWKPNETFFLQAVGDQLVLAVTHTRLRSLVRTLSVADEKTGLLTRGAYIDCLLSETNRSRTHGTPVSLLLIEIDGGGELLRRHGDGAIESYVDQLARTLCSSIRQTDIAVKYTAWSLVFILPDTTLEKARMLADKLRQIAATVPTSWGQKDLTISAVVAEESSRPADDTEDRVTEWINRAETGLEEVRDQGGNAVMALATP